VSANAIEPAKLRSFDSKFPSFFKGLLSIGSQVGLLDATCSSYSVWQSEFRGFFVTVVDDIGDSLEKVDFTEKEVDEVRCLTTTQERPI
jgi:hypothetical protein